MSRGWMGLVAVLAVAGCKKEPKAAEVLASEQKNLEPVAAAIEKVAAQVSKLPAATGAITLEGPPPVMMSPGTPPTGNAVYAFDRDLVDLGTYPLVPLRSSATSQLASDCWSLAKKGTMAGIKAPTYSRDPMLDPDDLLNLRDTVAKCKQLRYLVVLHLTGFKDTTYIDKESFGAGNAKGNALVFDLATGKFLGGVAFKAASSQFTKSTPETDLWNNFYDSVKSALTAKLPTARL